jgi:hypothetical protein
MPHLPLLSAATSPPSHNLAGGQRERAFTESPIVVRRPVSEYVVGYVNRAADMGEEFVTRSGNVIGLDRDRGVKGDVEEFVRDGLRPNHHTFDERTVLGPVELLA